MVSRNKIKQVQGCIGFLSTGSVQVVCRGCGAEDRVKGEGGVWRKANQKPAAP